MSNLVLKTPVAETHHVRVYEPFQPDVITCDSKEHFIDILNANKDKFNEMSTQKLNKMFNIPGYKVTKVNNEICLRSIKPCEHVGESVLISRIEKIEADNKRIIEAINQQADLIDQIKAFINTNFR